MTRLATHQRKMQPVSREAWRVITGETMIETNKGKQQATKLIYHWYKQWMRSALKRPISSRGEPLTPGFVWLSSQYFDGRAMVDVAQELEGEALEGAARGVETHDPTKGPLIAWMKRIMLQHLNAEIERWADTSTSVNELGARHEPLDRLLSASTTEDEPDDEEFVRLTKQQRKDRERLVAEATALADPADEVESDSVDRELCEIALRALSAMEREALLRFSEGESYHSIARNLDLSGATSAHRIVDRARLKAQEALA